MEPAKKCHVLTEEKLDEMGARLEHMTEITEMPCRRDGISKSLTHMYSMK
jgi:hypothetical protein